MFNEASKTDLRLHFQEWARSAASEEQPHAKDRAIRNSARYRYFAQIDKAALESMLENADNTDVRVWDSGHIKVIDAYWRSNADIFAEARANGEELDVDAEEEAMLTGKEGHYKPTEDCVEEEVGWKMIHSSDLVPIFYQTLDTSSYDGWHFSFGRPPHVVWL